MSTLSRRATTAGFFLSILSIIGCKTIHPNPPQIAPTPEPSVAVSYAHVPAAVALSRIQSAAEGALPPSIEAAPFNHNKGGGPDAPNCGWNAGYKVERDPIALSGSGSSLTTTLNVRYQVTARKRVPCPGPLITGSCGYGGEWPRRASATISTSLSVQPDWTPVVHTTVGGVQAGNTCGITFLNIDVTSKVIGFFGSKLNDLASKLDEQATSALALRDRIQKVWSQAQQPIDLGQGAWLVIDPEQLSLEPIAVVGGELRSGAQLSARPRVVLGSKPATTAKPLPNAGAVAPGNAFSVLLPIEITHAALRDQFRKALHVDTGGAAFPPTGKQQIRIVDADVYGYGQQAVVWLRFVGSAKGEMYLVGTPSYDAATNVLSFPDLQYDVHTWNVIVKALDWLEHDAFRDYLRGRAVFDLSGPTGAAKTNLVSALNKTYGDVTLTGTVDNLSLLGFFGKPQQAQFTAYVQTNGTLGLTVN